MDNIPIEETWQAMEDLQREGLVRNIGISNFEIEDIMNIQRINQLPIAVNQFECHPYHQRTELRA